MTGTKEPLGSSRSSYSSAPRRLGSTTLDDIASFKSDPLVAGLIAVLSKNSTAPTQGEVDEAFKEIQWKLEDARRQAERRCLEALRKRGREVEEIHTKLQGCLGTLALLGDDLKKFADSMSEFLCQVRTIQQQSESAADELTRQRDIQATLTAYIDKLVIESQFEQAIKTAPCVDKRFVEALQRLDTKLAHMDEPGFDNYLSARQARTAIQELKTVAVSRCREFCMSKIQDFFQKEVGSIQVLQQVITNQTKPLYKFLSSANPMAALQIRQQYVTIIYRSHYRQGCMYLDHVKTLKLKAVGRNDFLAQLLDFGAAQSVLDAAVKDVFTPPQSEGLDGSLSGAGLGAGWLAGMWHRVNPQHAHPSPITPSAMVAKNKDIDRMFVERLSILDNAWTKEPLHIPAGPILNVVCEYPEEIFRSCVKALGDTGLGEWQFIQEYFFDNDWRIDSASNRTGIGIREKHIRSTDRTRGPDELVTDGKELLEEGDDQHSGGEEASDTNDEGEGDESGMEGAMGRHPTLCFEEVYLKTMLHFKETLEKDISQNHDLISLALIWRIADHKFLVPGMSNCMDALQIVAATQFAKVGRVLERVLRSAADAAMAVSRLKGHFARQQEQVAMPYLLVNFISGIIIRVAHIVLIPPAAIAQTGMVLQWLQGAVQTLRYALQTSVALAPYGPSSELLKRRLAALSTLDMVNQALDTRPATPVTEIAREKQESTAQISVRKMTDELQAWVIETIDAEIDKIAELLLAIQCGRFADTVRQAEAALSGEHKLRHFATDGSLRQLQELTQSRALGWNNDLEGLYSTAMDAAENRLSPGVIQELLPKMFTVYIMFTSRLEKVVETLCSEVQALKDTVTSSTEGSGESVDATAETSSAQLANFFDSALVGRLKLSATNLPSSSKLLAKMKAYKPIRESSGPGQGHH